MNGFLIDGNKKMAFCPGSCFQEGGCFVPAARTVVFPLSVAEKQFSDLVNNAPVEEKGPQFLNPVTVNSEV